MCQSYANIAFFTELPISEGFPPKEDCFILCNYWAGLMLGDERSWVSTSPTNNLFLFWLDSTVSCCPEKDNSGLSKLDSFKFSFKNGQMRMRTSLPMQEKLKESRVFVAWNSGSPWNPSKVFPRQR